MGWFNKNKDKEEGDQQPKREKKPFNETGFGKFVQKAKPILGTAVNTVIGNVVNGATGGALGIVKDILVKSDDPQSEILLQEFELKQMEWEQEMARIDLQFFQAEMADRADAREMYKQNNKMADYIARQVMNWGLPAVGALLLIEVGLIIGMKEHVELVAIVSTSIGAVSNQLLSERVKVIQFFFGSSRGSKEKEEEMRKSS